MWHHFTCLLNWLLDYRLFLYFNLWMTIVGYRSCAFTWSDSGMSSCFLARSAATCHFHLKDWTWGLTCTKVSKLHLLLISIYIWHHICLTFFFQENIGESVNQEWHLAHKNCHFDNSRVYLTTIWLTQMSNLCKSWATAEFPTMGKKNIWI